MIGLWIALVAGALATGMLCGWVARVPGRYRSVEDRIAWMLEQADRFDEERVRLARKGPRWTPESTHAAGQAEKLRQEAKRLALEELPSVTASPCPDAGGTGGYR